MDFVRLISVDPGYNTQNTLTMHLRLLARPDGPGQMLFVEDVTRRMKVLPGVTDVAFASSVPIDATSTISNQRIKMLESPFSGDPSAPLLISPNL